MNWIDINMILTCACGYKAGRGDVFDEEEGTVDIIEEGDEPFVKSKMKMYLGSKYGFPEFRIVYICPKCGTLKINIEEY